MCPTGDSDSVTSFLSYKPKKNLDLLLELVLKIKVYNEARPNLKDLLNCGTLHTGTTHMRLP